MTNPFAALAAASIKQFKTPKTNKHAKAPDAPRKAGNQAPFKTNDDKAVRKLFTFPKDDEIAKLAKEIDNHLFDRGFRSKFHKVRNAYLSGEKHFVSKCSGCNEQRQIDPSCKLFWKVFDALWRFEQPGVWTINNIECVKCCDKAAAEVEAKLISAVQALQTAYGQRKAKLQAVVEKLQYVLGKVNNLAPRFERVEAEKPSVFYVATRQPEKVLQMTDNELAQTTTEGDTLLHFLRDEEALRCASFVVSANAANKVGQTPIHLACRAGDLATFRALLGVGADPEIKCNIGNNALHYAVLGGNLEMVQYLSVPELYCENLKGETPIHIAVTISNTDVLRFLVKEYHYGDAECSPFHLAACCNNFEGTKVLLEAGFEPRFDRGNHPIHIAASLGHTKVVGVYVRHGVSVNLPNSMGRTCLHLASVNLHNNLFHSLMQMGANIEAQDKDGKKPVHLAKSPEHRQALTKREFDEKVLKPAMEEDDDDYALLEETERLLNEAEEEEFRHQLRQETIQREIEEMEEEFGVYEEDVYEEMEEEVEEV